MAVPDRRGAGRAAIGLFILASLTGALFRFAAVHGWTLGFDPANIRHAHSHLMYFGWVTPALFVLIARMASRQGAAPPSRGLMASILMLALAAWGSFLLWGYAPADLAGASIPVSVALSGLSMVAWYFWIAWYMRVRSRWSGTATGSLWDSAVAFLALSTLGAWAISATVPMDAPPALKAAFAHMFLAYFGEGWLVFGVAGLAFHRLEVSGRVPSWAIRLMIGGTALGFIMGMPSYLVPERLKLVGQLGGMAWGLGAVGLGWAWWKSAGGSLRKAWGPIMLVLATKGSSQVAAILVPGMWWADIPSMRILYLHVLLLGFVTTGLGAELGGRVANRLLQAAAACVIVALIPLTPLWPGAPAGPSWFSALAWISLLPVLAALPLLIGRLTPDD